MPGWSWVLPAELLLGLTSATFHAASQGARCWRHLSLQWGQVQRDKGRNQRHAQRNCLHKKAVDIFQYCLLQQEVSFFPKAASLFESDRKEKKLTKLEGWVQTAVSTGSMTDRNKSNGDFPQQARSKHEHSP